MKIVIFRVNDDFHKMLKIAAARQHRTMTEYVTAILLPILLRDKQLNEGEE